MKKWLGMIKPKKQYCTLTEHQNTFCWCGRLIHKNKRCKIHQGKDKPEERRKIGHYSGDSRWRQDMGMFQAKMGR